MFTVCCVYCETKLSNSSNDCTITVPCDALKILVLFSFRNDLIQPLSECYHCALMRMCKLSAQKYDSFDERMNEQRLRFNILNSKYKTVYAFNDHHKLTPNLDLTGEID